MPIHAQHTEYTGPGKLATAAFHQPTDELPSFLARTPLRAAFRLQGISKPSGAQLEAFRKHLAVCDPPADELVAAMRREGSRLGRAQFEQALEHGLETVEAPLPELVAFFEALEDVPFWVDYAVLDKAARAAARVPIRSLLYLTSALPFPMSYVGARVNEVLLRGGDLDTRAAARVIETSTWFIECTTPGGMQRFGEGFKSTARIRLIHAYIRSGLNQLDEWDTTVMGDPVNQVHQTITMIPITGVALLTPTLGHWQTRSERAAMLQLFRYMSHLMGVVPALQASTTADLMRLAWLAVWSEMDPDASSAALTNAVYAAIPQIHGMPEESSVRGRLKRRIVTRLHSDATRVFLGREYSDAARIPRLSPALAVAPAFIAYNSATSIAQAVVPGARRRAADRGAVERVAAIKAASTRVKTRTFERDDAVASIRRRDQRLRAGRTGDQRAHQRDSTATPGGRNTTALSLGTNHS